MSIGIEPGDSHPLIATISYVYDYHGSDNLPKTPMSSSSPAMSHHSYASPPIHRLNITMCHRHGELYERLAASKQQSCTREVD
ncbi:unnamed protein product [Fusarium graminearum]|uniref:Uncharacterized protein n=1 Tax=Gibberella zeae TaxID=5518 RepID=A0A9N8RP16_GIBZA|nr:unnamed protein product [Fusarium graminearum]CAG2007871.1 unnamed protein product [Fusarium graminearum]